MDNMIVIYLESILKLIKKSDTKEESLEGLVLQLAMLEKLRDIFNKTIYRLQEGIERHAHRSN